VIFVIFVIFVADERHKAYWVFGVSRVKYVYSDGELTGR
jgi:hypothetical protein